MEKTGTALSDTDTNFPTFGSFINCLEWVDFICVEEIQEDKNCNILVHLLSIDFRCYGWCSWTYISFAAT